MSGKKQSLKSYYAGDESKLKPTKNGQSESDTVVAPKVWKSSPKHPTAYLVYITDKEAALLAKKDMHGSGVDREMHFGPNGIPSFQGDGGDGGGGGGDSGGGDTSSTGSGDVGPGGDPSGTGETAGGASSDPGPGSPQGGGSNADAEGSGSDLEQTYEQQQQEEAQSLQNAENYGIGPNEFGSAPADEGAGTESGGTTFSDALAVTTLAPVEKPEKDDSPRQFPTREQNVKRRAAGAGAQRVDNDVDLLGYRGGYKRRTGAARSSLGRGR